VGAVGKPDLARPMQVRDGDLQQQCDRGEDHTAPSWLVRPSSARTISFSRSGLRKAGPPKGRAHPHFTGSIRCS
jgi:hypothetical protein